MEKEMKDIRRNKAFTRTYSIGSNKSTFNFIYYRQGWDILLYECMCCFLHSHTCHLPRRLSLKKIILMCSVI